MATVRGGVCVDAPAPWTRTVIRSADATPRASGSSAGLDAPQIVSSDTPRYLSSPEVRTYKIKVDLIKAIVEDDHDIHLVVSAPGHQFRTMTTELPDTRCKGAAGSYKKAALASGIQLGR